MARHKLKPFYNKNEINGDFMDKIVAFFNGPYDDRDESANASVSLREVSREFGISVVKARKILITAGQYSIKQSRLINELREQGKTTDEIVEITGLSKSSVFSYLPYEKTIYHLDPKSTNADRQERYRKRKVENKHNDAILSSLYALRSMEMSFATNMSGKEVSDLIGVDCKTCLFSGSCQNCLLNDIRKRVFSIESLLANTLNKMSDINRRKALLEIMKSLSSTLCSLYDKFDEVTNGKD